MEKLGNGEIDLGNLVPDGRISSYRVENVTTSRCDVYSGDTLLATFVRNANSADELRFDSGVGMTIARNQNNIY